MIISMGNAIIKRVDHIIVQAEPPEPLFHLLRDQLLLPVAWQIRRDAFFTSGGIHLGNLNLQIMQLNHHKTNGSGGTAKLNGLGFELNDTQASLYELDRRGIPHTPPMPFYQFDEQGWQITSWTNVYLGGLIGGVNPAGRMFFDLSHFTPANTWEKVALPTDINRKLTLPFVYDRVYPNGITYSVEYNPAWRGINMRPEPDRAGLDIKQVQQITIGTSDFLRARERWRNLLAPHPEVGDAIWVLPDGLHLRLKPASHDGLLSMVWQAHSLNRSVQFLSRRDMMGKEKSGVVQIAPEKIFGLDIRLVQ